MGGHSSTGNSAGPERLAGVQIQSSVYGKVIPLVFGTDRVPCNLVWSGDFTSTPITQSTGGGKGGGGGGGSVTTGYQYYANCVLAICEGPINKVYNVWQDSTSGAAASYFGFGFTTGAIATPSSTKYPTAHPNQALAYSGTVVAYNPKADLGTTAQVKNMNFEVIGFNGSVADTGTYAYALDCLPSDIIKGLLFNPNYGLGWSSTKLDDTNSGYHSYDMYCNAMGFYLSMSMVDQKSAADHIKEILDATNTEAVWGVGIDGRFKLKLVPYGDSDIDSGSYHYRANTSPIYDLTYDDFCGVVDSAGKATGNDPIEVSRGSQQEVKNSVPVEFSDRTQAYAMSVIESPEPVDVAVNGLKKAESTVLHCIKRAAHAQAISSILGQKQVYVRNKYNFSLPWRYVFLEPMDLVTITDPKLGLDHHVVRINSISYPEDGSSSEGFLVEAEEWPFGVATATLYTVQSSEGQPSPRQSNADPGDVFMPVVAPLSYLFTGPTNQYVIAAAGQSKSWGGCEVWGSTDDKSYAYLGTIFQPCTYGNVIKSTGVDIVDPYLVNPGHIPSPSNNPYQVDNRGYYLVQCATPYMDLPSCSSADAQKLTNPVFHCSGSLTSTHEHTGVELFTYENSTLSDASYKIILKDVVDNGSTITGTFVLDPSPSLSWNYVWNASVATISAVDGPQVSFTMPRDTGDMVGLIACQLGYFTGTFDPSRPSQNFVRQITLEYSITSEDGVITLIDLLSSTNQSGNFYYLQKLYRGAYGTYTGVPIMYGDFPDDISKQFIVMDDKPLVTVLPYSPQNDIYLKFLSFNTFGGAKQSLADVATYKIASGHLDLYRLPNSVDWTNGARLEQVYIISAVDGLQIHNNTTTSAILHQNHPVFRGSAKVRYYDMQDDVDGSSLDWSSTAVDSTQVMTFDIMWAYPVCPIPDYFEVYVFGIKYSSGNESDYLVAKKQTVDGKIRKVAIVQNAPATAFDSYRAFVKPIYINVPTGIFYEQGPDILPPNPSGAGSRPTGYTTVNSPVVQTPENAFDADAGTYARFGSSGTVTRKVIFTGFGTGVVSKTLKVWIDTETEYNEDDNGSGITLDNSSSVSIDAVIGSNIINIGGADSGSNLSHSTPIQVNLSNVDLSQLSVVITLTSSAAKHAGDFHLPQWADQVAGMLMVPAADAFADVYDITLS